MKTSRSTTWRRFRNATSRALARQRGLTLHRPPPAGLRSWLATANPQQVGRCVPTPPPPSQISNLKS